MAEVDSKGKKGRGRGEGRGRGKGGRTGGPVSEEELAKRIATLEAEDSAQHADEYRIKEELKQAEWARDQARRKENQVREAAEDSRRRAVRNIEYYKNELADLKKVLLEHDRANKGHIQRAQASSDELDAMVLAQASAMARRDELAVEASSFEEQARANEALATKEGAKVKLVEEKVKKERAKLDAFKAHVEALRRNVDDSLGVKKRTKEELNRRQKESGLSLDIWRYLTAFLFIAIFIVLFFQTMYGAESGEVF